MHIQTTGLCFILALGAFGLGCGGDKEASTTTPAVEASTAPAGDRMAIAKGTVKFKKTCATCHGVDAKGMPNNGKDLTISAFVKEKSDEELLAFVLVGRPATDTTPVMPPKGGFVDLSDEDILNVIAYIRTIEE